MEVELKPHIGIMAGGDPRRPREVKANQYRIWVDGVAVGFLSYHEGAAVRLHRSFTPIEADQIRELVQEELPKQTIGPVLQAPAIPKQKKEAVKNDDFD